MLCAVILKTRGFLSLPKKVQEYVIEKTLERITTETDMIVFDPDAADERYEDEGRTLILPTYYMEKVYAKLDDYGSAENLSNKIGYKVTTRYVITFLLPEEW